MIYSRWKPSGGYDYFQVNQELPIGDDPPPMHVPTAAGNIGTPAQECGYLLPSGAVQIGAGSEPQGLIAPTYFKFALGATPEKPEASKDWSTSPLVWGVAGAAAGGLVGYMLWGRR